MVYIIIIIMCGKSQGMILMAGAHFGSRHLLSSSFPPETCTTTASQSAESRPQHSKKKGAGFRLFIANIQEFEHIVSLTTTNKKCYLGEIQLTVLSSGSAERRPEHRWDGGRVIYL